MPRRRFSGSPEARFESRVVRGDSCWEWDGYRAIRRGKPTGYGRFSLENGRPIQAHRFAYELWVGPIPDGYVVHHRCENPGCVRPDHLELVPDGEHQRRHAYQRGTVTNAYGTFPAIPLTTEQKRLRDRDWMRAKRARVKEQRS